MSGLIITIISIALVAVAAIMGAYYGGIAFSQNNTQAIAASIINEAQQILSAARIWSANNGQLDISGMGTAGASGTGMSMLVSSQALSNWPPLAGGISVSSSGTGSGPQPNTGSVTTGAWDNGCYSLNGYVGRFWRLVFAYNGQNYVLYEFSANAGDVACTLISGSGSFSSSTHPIVKVAQAINKTLGVTTSNSNLVWNTPTGLPFPPVGSGFPSASSVYDTSSANQVTSKVYIDTNGTIQTNYCYLVNGVVSLSYASITTNIISCVFGPS